MSLANEPYYPNRMGAGPTYRDVLVMHILSGRLPQHPNGIPDHHDLENVTNAAIALADRVIEKLEATRPKKERTS